MRSCSPAGRDRVTPARYRAPVPSPPTDLEGLLALLERRGHASYLKELVTQLAHACQCAGLLARRGAPDTLVVAGLLHDVGWFTGERDHAAAGAALCRASGLPPEVSEPVRLHVAAKRFLCGVDETYMSLLSEASRRTLRRQGGVFSPDEQAAFSAEPFFADAVALRRADEAAKVPGAPAPSFAELARLARVVCARSAGVREAP